MTMWLVYHNDERSRLIKDVHVGVFHSKEDAEQYVKDAMADIPVSAGLNFSRRLYRIKEIPVITKVPIGDEEE
tara:strand:- start:115 stop:333 length:219 start_codon:yes stop_codon:yes gene_type:complete